MKSDPISCAILLAAGRGKRLSPYTDTTPKPLLSVDGKPTLTFILDSLLLAGVQRVALVTHYLADQIEVFAEGFQQQHDVEILCVKQKSLAGTADAVESAVQQLPADWITGTVLLSATDYLLPKNYFPDLVEFRHQNESAVTVSYKEIEGAQAMSSSVRFNDDGSIAEIVEKPELGKEPSRFTANLTYILPGELLPMVEDVEPSPRGEREVQTAINRYLAQHGPAKGLLQPTPPEWQSKFAAKTQ